MSRSLFLFPSFFSSRESLIARTLEDISSFDRPKAEAEVDKFLMDAEMVSHLLCLVYCTRKKGIIRKSFLLSFTSRNCRGVKLIHLLIPRPLLLTPI
jgi:hypothetical protein